jgi:D-3-phosphoglycerate dehydrogenase
MFSKRPFGWNMKGENPVRVLIPQDVENTGKAYLQKRGYEVVVGDKSWDQLRLKKEIAQADGVIARAVHIYDKVILEAAPHLKIIARYGMGVDNIDVPEAERLGIWVTITKSCNANAVAEHAMTLILACAKNLVYAYQQTAQGSGWDAVRYSLYSTELRGLTLGVIGLGNIGRRIAEIAHNGFNMNILGYDAYADISLLPSYIRPFASVDDVFKEADAVTIHVPLNEGTRNMVTLDQLKLMKKTGILVNCSRGHIVNEDALYTALSTGVIASAALDVYATEPVAAGHPLFTLRNYIGTPHFAGTSRSARDLMSLSCAIACDDVLSGRRPQFPINHPAGLQ